MYNYIAFTEIKIRLCSSIILLRINQIRYCCASLMVLVITIASALSYLRCATTLLLRLLNQSPFFLSLWIFI